MNDHALSDFRLRRHLMRLAFGLAAVLALPAQAAEPGTLSRSDTPQTLEGEGDRVLLVEGPFSLRWRTPGGRFAIKATAEGAEKPTAAGSTTGKGNGGIGVRGEKRYRVAITASGPWRVTVTW
jgi:hypothetical protein